MQHFRRLIGAALLAGLIAGLWLSAARQIWVVPLILQAEALEGPPPAHGDHPGHGTPADGPHAQPADGVREWQPAGGFERNAWTWAANAITSIGFALLLAAGYGLSGRPVTGLRGLLWGLAGFAVFSLAPAWGLPPALPGAPEMPLAARQLWWLETVTATAGGLCLLAFAGRRWWRWLGLPLLALPHVVGAPHALAVLPAPLADLTRQFVAATLLVNLSSWLVLGAVSGWVWSKNA
jgi:cobalt transporter subunit CbtA